MKMTPSGAVLTVSGRESVSELLAPLLFCSGATTVIRTERAHRAGKRGEPRSKVAVVVGDEDAH